MGMMLYSRDWPWIYRVCRADFKLMTAPWTPPSSYYNCWDYYSDRSVPPCLLCAVSWMEPGVHACNQPSSTLPQRRHFWFYEIQLRLASNSRSPCLSPSSTGMEGVQCVQFLLVSLLAKNSFIVYWFSKIIWCLLYECYPKDTRCRKKEESKAILMEMLLMIFGNICIAIFSVDLPQ